MLKKKRMKTLTSLVLAAAMTVLTVNPAMGEEIMPEISGGGRKRFKHQYILRRDLCSG